MKHLSREDAVVALLHAKSVKNRFKHVVALVKSVVHVELCDVLTRSSRKHSASQWSLGFAAPKRTRCWQVSPSVANPKSPSQEVSESRNVTL